MTTARPVLEKALVHADVRTATDEAVDDLLITCRGSRVAVVRARQEILKRSEASPDNPVMARAVELLDEALRRGSWDVN